MGHYSKVLPPLEKDQGSEFKEATALMTKNQVAAIFYMSPDTFGRAVTAGQAPRPIMVGKSPRWKKTTVQGWIEGQDREANGET